MEKTMKAKKNQVSEEDKDKMYGKLRHINDNSELKKTGNVNEKGIQSYLLSSIANNGSNNADLNHNNSYDELNELFLVPEDILDMNIETVCEELARLSPGLEKRNDSQRWEAKGLRAARASSRQQTIWIYRGG